MDEMNYLLKKRIIIVILVLFSMMQLPAGQAAQTAVTEGKSCLWEAKKGDVKFYLLGSIHLLKEDMYPLNPVIEKAFEQSGFLAVEAEMNQEKMTELSMMMMKKGIYQGEDSLKKNISEETYTLLKEWMTKNNMKVEQFEKFKPWFVAMTVESMEFMKMGFRTDLGIDMHFMKKAKGKKEIFELEGFDFQLNLFSGFTPEECDAFLFSALKEADDTKNAAEKMMKAWKTGNSAHMETSMAERIKKFPKIKGVIKKILDDRNFTMRDKILKLISEKNNGMIIVGVAHMVGKNGLVRLLQEKGFTVTQL